MPLLHRTHIHDPGKVDEEEGGLVVDLSTLIPCTLGRPSYLERGKLPARRLKVVRGSCSRLRPKKRRWGRRNKESEPETGLESVEDDEKEPTVDEMYSSLGLFGRSVVGGIDVALVTATSYLSGACLGYFGGGLFGASVLFQNANAPPPGSEAGMRIIDPNNGFFKEARGRLGKLNSKALTTGKSWGELSAAFSGFHALARVARGNVEDKWNGVIGSACTGAYMARKGGPNAMVQGAATYASFTYLIDVFFGTTGGGNKRRQLPDGTMIDDQFEFKDEPVY